MTWHDIFSQLYRTWVLIETLARAGLLIHCSKVLIFMKFISLLAPRDWYIDVVCNNSSLFTTLHD